MHVALDDQALAELLPGAWTVAATNFPMWLTGKRRNPKFSWGVVSTDPLILSDDVEYTDADGRQKHVLGQNSWHREEFVWRGKGILRPFASRWSVTGASDDGTVAAIRFSKSMATPAGVDIVVRDGVHHSELRAMIARGSVSFGLSAEDFASLSWLSAGPGR